MRITDQSAEKIRELHGVNCAPYALRLGSNQTGVERLFRYAGIPRSRLHDCQGPWGGTYFIDVPNIFRNFDADENDPASYDFYYSDEYITAIIKSGAQIVYRLGITIEWGSKKYASIPPKDFAKWARICEHIVRHYNEGWNDGFHYGIEYWKIWNEPENPPMWQGTKEQFFELYRLSSKHLKSCFPHLKIGGYGGCGFYAVFRPNMNDFYKSFPVYFIDFLKMVKENGCPLDFYSWHIYTDKLDEIEKSAVYVRENLDKFGFTETESHLNEWNYGAEGKQFEDKDTMVGASFCAGAFALMQNLSIDLAQYYVATSRSVYNGLLDMRSGAFTPVTHVFAAFNTLFRSDNALKIDSAAGDPPAIAARAGDKKYVLISNYRRGEGSFTLDIPNAKIAVSILGDGGFTPFREAESSVTLPLSDYTVYFAEASAL